MIDVTRLTNEIISNPDHIIKILEDLGHTNCRDRGKYIQCSNLDGDNKGAISVLKDKLLYQNFTRGRKGNIFSLVMDEKNVGFREAIEFVIKSIGYSGASISVKYPFHGFYHSICHSGKSSNEDIKTYPLSVLPRADCLSEMWFKDGVDYLTQERFGIRLDLDTNCIVIPEYNFNGELVGAKARYNGDCDPSERWSMYLPFAKSLILYGWTQNYNDIVQNQLVYIVEAEKSVCQAASWGTNLMLAIGGHDISQTQASRIKSLGVDVVIGFDEGISEKEIIEQAQKVVINSDIFKNRVGYIPMNGMPTKASPTDMGHDTFLKLKESIKWLN